MLKNGVVNQSITAVTAVHMHTYVTLLTFQSTVCITFISIPFDSVKLLMMKTTSG